MVASSPCIERIGPRAAQDVVVEGAAGDRIIALAPIGQNEAQSAGRIDTVIPCGPRARGRKNTPGAVQIAGAGGVAVAGLCRVAKDCQNAAVAACLRVLCERNRV